MRYVEEFQLAVLLLVASAVLAAPPAASQQTFNLPPVAVASADDKEIASERLIKDWQDQLDATGRLHIEWSTSSPVNRIHKGVCLYEVSHNLKINPSEEYTITMDPRVQVVHMGPKFSAFIEIVEPSTVSTWTGRFIFRDLDIESKSEFGSCIKTTYAHAQMTLPRFEDCTFRAKGYCIDLDNVGYCITPTFRNIKTAGGGALRLKGRKSGNAGARYWASSQAEIRNWHHNGGNRVGPAFDLCGVGGLVMENIIDEQHRQLHPLLIEQGWTGPISLRIDTPKFPNVIRNYWCEAVKGKAPGCWVYEFRATDISSVGKENTIDAYSLGYHGNWPEEHTMRVVGGSGEAIRPDGGTNNGAQTQSIIVRIHNAWQPSGEGIVTHGKAAVQFFRPMYQGDTKLNILRERFYVEGVQRISTHHKPSTPDGPSHQVGMDKENEIEFYPAINADLNWVTPEPQPEPDPTPPGPDDGSGTATGDR